MGVLLRTALADAPGFCSSYGDHWRRLQTRRRCVEFSCTHYFLKATLSEVDDELQRSKRRQIEAGIARLPSVNQERARRFIFNDRLPAYGTRPLLSPSPGGVEALLTPELSFCYARLSAAAHGGFLGWASLEISPNVHPNQRSDPRSQALAL